MIGRAGNRDLAMYVVAAISALALIATYGASPHMPLGRYFGDVPPVLAISGIVVAGGISLAALARAGWTGGAWSRRSGSWICTLAAAFGAVTIVSDIVSPFPAGMNAPLPEAFVFYPVIGLVVEALFHLTPLAILLSLFRLAGLDTTTPRLFWIAAIPVALTEPVFQVALGGGTSPPWQSAEVALHLAGFGLVQMWLLRRGGFAAAFAFRLAYYAIWHIAWGWARLGLLFPAG